MAGTKRATENRKGLVARVCERCGANFFAYRSKVATGGGRYCSKTCKARMIALKHGMSRTRLYVCWSDMKARCSNPKSVGFAYYGGRGIKVAPEWIASFEAFKDWALANGYQDGLELDRRDNDLGYSPDNCRWATRVEQMRNTRKRSNAQTSRFKGVSWCANASRWRVQLHANGKPIHVGLFRTEEDAARAYDAAAQKRYGEFARTNFTGGAPS